MTKPDEAHRAWDECATARFEDEMNGNPLDLPQGMPNIVDFKDGYRAGAAASEARIKVLEEALKDSVTAMQLLLDAVQKHNAESGTFLSGFPLHLLSIEIAAARALLKEADQ